jgi:RimJ/RimL family protein N-acetyltransferase
MEVKLILFTIEHITETFKWIKDTKLQKLFLIRGKLDWKNHIEYFDKKLKDSSQKVYAIMLDEEHIGNCGYKNLSVEQQDGELWIYIGNSAMRGKKIGTMATKLLIEEGIENLHLKNIVLHVLDNNILAIKLYKKFGFVEVKNKYEENEWKNSIYNIIRMELHV